jgi:hypothetical protein
VICALVAALDPRDQDATVGVIDDIDDSPIAGPNPVDVSRLPREFLYSRWTRCKSQGCYPSVNPPAVTWRFHVIKVTSGPGVEEN